MIKVPVQSEKNYDNEHPTQLNGYDFVKAFTSVFRVFLNRG